MSTTTEDFIRTFEALREEVNRRAGEPNSHTLQIDTAAGVDPAIDKNRRLIRYIRDVRNALQHPQHGARGHAVQITDAFLNEAKALLRHLQDPPTVRSVGVARRDIRTARLGDRLGDLADMMKRDGFSHLPILDERDVVMGVFNEAAVFDHLWAEPARIIERDMRVEDILPHCSLDADHTETFQFVRPGTLLDDLVGMFVAPISRTTRLGAAFVTASGKDTEPLQRMITPWDVLANGRN
ncbi:CBS domain-containing protein [Roseomonas fluvialis]|uniref:CBS domain-containing protein n=1 Tax=Roseomonas fluvialis TaxID=1750527 RepID=A0ABN6P8T7_9PROT|nr:CBS domain-containing protein [Roseomonas fluvialis]BDG74066.1 hypothetical protein Rmf_39950 [Roseomonas fluvialis]